MARIGRPRKQTVAAHHLAAWMEYKCLTNDKLAARIAELSEDGICEPSTISRLASGKSKLTERKVYELSAALGVEPGALFVAPEIYLRRAQRLTVVDGLSDEELARAADLIRLARAG